MKIIFCLSYLSVPMTISIVESYCDDFLIITSEPKLATFFKRLYISKKVFLLKRINLSKNPIKLLLNIFRIELYKNKIRKCFVDLENVEVYFFAVAFCELECWIIKLLSRNNQIYFKPAVEIKYSNEDHSLYAKVGKVIREFLYSIEVVPLNINNRAVYKIRKSFFEKIGSKEPKIQLNIDSAYIKILRNIGCIERTRILFLSGWVVDEFVERKEYIQKIDALIEYIETYYGKGAVAIKAHPQKPEYFSKEETLIKIPIDIPANLLVKNFEIVIGYNSATLIEASNAQKISISLLKYLEPINRETRDLYFGYLNYNTNNKIHYPENIYELNDLLQLK